MGEPEWMEQNFFQALSARRLKDMCIQHFHNFRTDDVNKCVIANTYMCTIYI